MYKFVTLLIFVKETFLFAVVGADTISVQEYCENEMNVTCKIRIFQAFFTLRLLFPCSWCRLLQLLQDHCQCIPNTLIAGILTIVNPK